MTAELMMDTLQATEMRRDILKRMMDLHGDTITLGKLLHRFDVGGGWKVLAMDDGEPRYESMWAFFRGVSKDWNLTSRYFYTLRDQGRAQEQSGVLGWSGSALTQLARLNDEPKKQRTVVEALQREQIEVKGEMVRRDARVPPAKAVANHVKWELPKKPEGDKRSVQGKAVLKATHSMGPLHAIIILLSDVIDQMNSTFVGMDEHEARKALRGAQKAVEGAHKLLHPFKEIAQ